MEIVDGRLNDLTPKTSEDIIKDIIRKHLDWFVVWGQFAAQLSGFQLKFNNLLSK